MEPVAAPVVSQKIFPEDIKEEKVFSEYEKKVVSLQIILKRLFYTEKKHFLTTIITPPAPKQKHKPSKNKTL